MAQIEAHEWFVNPIWKTTLDIDVEQLSLYVLDLQKNNLGLIKSNQGGWHSDTIFNNAPIAHQDLVYQINQLLVEIHKYMGFKSNSTPSIKHSWYIVNGPGHYNKKHLHFNSLYSGAFYVNIPDGDSGDIIFYRDNLSQGFINENNIENYNNMNSSSASYKPETGMLLIFPSWMEHEVTANLTSSNRIVFSFNASAED
jgi:uncharacterized protein (TIGR02466 family)